MLPAKPADLYLGVVDLFGVLIPGLVMAAIVAPDADLLFEGGVIGRPSRGAVTAGAYFVAGWIIGQVLRAAGELMDLTIYDKWYLPAFKRRPLVPPWRKADDFDDLKKAWPRRDKVRLAFVALKPSYDRRLATDPLRAAAKALALFEIEALRVERYGGLHKVPLGLNGWVQVEVARVDPGASVTADRLTADSKFFRSFFFVSLVAAALSDHTAPVMAGCAALAVTSVVAYCLFRWKASITLLRSYVQVRLALEVPASNALLPLGATPAPSVAADPK